MGASEAHISEKRKQNILVRELEARIGPEMAREISVLAQPILASVEPSGELDRRKSRKLICPSGKSVSGRDAR
jgi:hypothetical protein